MLTLTGLRPMWRLAAVGTVWALLISPAAVAQTWQGSSSPEDLRYRLDILDAELADIRARLGVAGATGAGTTQRAPVAGGDLSAIEGELRRLTAEVERMQAQIARIQEDATRRFGDIEFRLTELEGGDLSQLGQTPQVGGLAPGIAPAGSGASVQVAATSVSEQGDFDRAVNDVQQGRFDQAEDGLIRFLGSYPNSPLTGDAFYWLGESRFVRGAFAEAAKAYLDGYQTMPQGPRAPHNLFKLGVALGRLGQLNEACTTLRQVRAQFPSAPDGLVGQADAEADRLTCG
ncbi:MAG: tol-pal system protein YbgF [Pseudomonadota bacterium]